MGAERTLTRRLAQFFGGGKGVRVGIGDDAAVVDARGEQIVLCCDPVVQGVHFLASAPLSLVGQKAVNRNLSDLAAMGATPDWLLVSLLLPRALPAAKLQALLRGIRAAARAGGARVIGGDVANTPGPLVVTVTACGHLDAGRALTRAGARPGDTIHVSGALGGSEAGHHLRFRPELAVGRWLVQQPQVHATIDVSDGLLLDLDTLLRESGAPGAEIDLERLPLRPAARRLAGGDLAAARRRALGDGEDYVLLWTQAAGPLARGGPLSPRARRPIGRVVERRGLWLVDGAERRRVQPLGYQHRSG